MKCWNCLNENPAKDHRCQTCDQPLKPNAAQKIASGKSVGYLLSELSHWDFVEDSARDRIREVYEARRQRLGSAADGNTSDWPESDWVVEPSPPAEQVPAVLPEPGAQELDPAEEIAPPKETSPAPKMTPAAEVAPATETTPAPEATPSEPPPPTAPPEPATPGYLETLVGEADIRWFHSLGAILVLAATVGWLRAAWDSYGKPLTGLLIAVSPIILHFFSHRLKKSVPLSARLLAILGNLLTAPALLALDVFDALPPSIPSHHYWTFSLLVSACILAWQAQGTKEKVPLFTGALCAVMAGWSQGALTTAFLSIVVGFLLAVESDREEKAWLDLRRQASFYCGSFGAFATLFLFETGARPFTPLLALTGALLFLHFPNIVGYEQQQSSRRLFVQASLSIVGSLLMRAFLDVTPGGVALYLLFAAALFLTVKPDSPLADLAAKMACAVGALSLLIGFGGDLTSVLQGEQSGLEAGLRFLFAVVGAVYFFLSARQRHNAGNALTLRIISLTCLTGGWFHMFFALYFPEGIKELTDLATFFVGLAVLEAVLVFGSKAMRNEEHETSLGYALCLMIVAIASSCVGATIGSSGWTVSLISHGVLAVVWERLWAHSSRDYTANTVQALRESLPRLALVALTAAFFNLHPWSVSVGLAVATFALVALCLIPNQWYSKAAWELGWLGLWSGFVVFTDPLWLVGASALAFATLLASCGRRTPSLLMSGVYGAILIITQSGHLPFGYLFLPAAAYALTAFAPRVDQERPKWGFDLLLSLAVLYSNSLPDGSPQSLIFLLTLTATAALFTKWTDNRVVSRYSPVVLGSSLFLWSLSQSTLETGLLLVIAGAVCLIAKQLPYRGEFGPAILLLGVGQVLTDTHLIFDGIALACGVILIEVAQIVRQNKIGLIGNITLVTLIFFQSFDALGGGTLPPLFLVASLLVALRAVHHDEYLPACPATVYFLFELNRLTPEHLDDFRLRLIPTALTLVGLALWKWKKELLWPKPAFQLGLALLVAPALLQFLVGQKMWSNFLWTLITGAAYVALSFPTRGEISSIVKRGGGVTLMGWAVVSLTRAALELPWQAGTLVVGILLVVAGVYVEKSRRKDSD